MVAVKEIMHSITVVPHSMPVSDAAKIMREKDIGSVLVERWGKIAGILTERDILKRVVAESLCAGDVRAGDVATNSLITIGSDADVLEANELLHKHNIRRLPVTENGKIIGIVTLRSISKNIPYAQLKRRTEWARPEYGTEHALVP